MEAGAATQSRLIGAILVENGLITRDQLVRALELQEKTGERLGEIVVAEFGVPRIELASILAEQWAAIEGTASGGTVKPAARLRVVAAPSPDNTATRRPIGEIFLELGFIDQAQLDAALEQQRETGARIGEVLVEQGSLTRLDLASALAEQWSSLEKLRPPSLEPRVEVPRERSSAEDLARVAGTLETRVDALEGRDPSDAVANLRLELDELRSRPNDVTAIAELRAMVERLEDQPGTPGQIEMLASEIAAVSARLDDLTTIGDLESRVDAAALQTEAAGNETRRLSAQLDALSSLEQRIDEIVVRVPADEAIEVLIEQFRSELAVVATNQSHGGDATNDAAIASISSRVDLVAVRLDDLAAGLTLDLRPALDALTERVETTAASATAETQGLGQRLASLENAAEADGGALERIAAELEELEVRTRERLEEPSAGPTHLDAVQSRLDDLAESVAQVSRPLEDLAAQVTALAGQGDTMTSLESRIGELEAGVAEGSSATDHREEMQVEGRAGDEKLEEALADVRSRVESLAAAASTAELAERVSELAARLDDEALRERIETVATRIDTVDSLEASIADVRQSMTELESVRVADALASGSRLAGVDRVLGALATQDSVDASLAGLRTELEATVAVSITEELDQRTSELIARVDRMTSHVDDSVIGVAEELTTRIDGNAADLGKRIEELAEGVVGLGGRGELDAAATRHVELVRSELTALAEAGDVRAAHLEERLAAADLARITSEKQRSEHTEESLASIRSALHERQLALDPQLEAQSAELAALRAQLGELQEDRAARVDMGVQLNDRITSELAALHALVKQETTVARAETASLGARIDELPGLRYSDIQAARAADERLGELQRLRATDAAAAASVGSELAGRLDELEARSAGVTLDVELRLRGDLDALAARLEEFDGASIEAREDLRVELERLAASMGWRLERIEESLATDETTALRATVEQLERRVEGQSALGEEQARATERALRKGLASLGERLVDSEAAYAEAGNTLRRSIERLGAAVVEADARMADRIPTSAFEGCVAFAPTDDGYRLIELQGEPPEVGAIVDVEASNSPLVVTRYGRSPLPFDGRPCAYLDRV